MSLRPVTVLYEDQRGTEVREFGPHALLTAIVADGLGVDIGNLKNVLRAIPKKGVSKVLSEVKLNHSRLTQDGRWLVVLIDDDRVREHLGLQSHTSEALVVQAILAAANAPTRVAVVLIVRNTESVVNAAAACMGLAAPVQKGIAERDAVLGAAAFRGGPQVLHCIRESVPSFADACDRVTVASSGC